ncbi:replication initiation factor domain-containing protein [Acidovorax sp. SUPP1855]|uniref:replication initiation factor domain-containing protein n=1 Tax=Acidovorax sp. SUPP1855 TaxID=431774 RepID=UPI0023DE4954|nr:replication initiation factor domain-containing protein [Acidovorax sp. SUPP1855]GKS83034.1 replication initiation factor domain-containing protein [Acidovorax sp. SUPP1855]
MTRPAKSVLNKHAQTCALVLDGNQVKVRLQAERLATGVPVHVDWVRFTVLLRNAPLPGPEILFPTPSADDEAEPVSGMERDQRGVRLMRLRKLLAQCKDADFSPAAQAMELAQRVCETLGPDYMVAPEVRKGHDFYGRRWSIERNDVEVGWVGYLASGDSPRQQAQAKTMHVNVYGSACTFAQSGWRDHMANLIDDVAGVITRCDLALDFFDGIRGGMDRVKADYEAGLMDSGGRRLKCNMVGDWCNGKARSFYVGSKEVGKQTNVYEKGHQLFGDKDESCWMRAELRWGNKARILNSNMLRRPADFFACASDWHAAILAEAEAVSFPVHVPCNPRLAAETIEAEVVRNVRWQIDVAAPSIALAFEHLGIDEFLEIVMHKKAPGRLQRFGKQEIACAYAKAFKRVTKGAGAGHAMA